ncbi:MAG TPA: hypothetical protein VGG73_05190 [Vicinamibacterales bacterium]
MNRQIGNSVSHILLVVGVIWFASVAPHASSDIPIVQLSYADGFDSVCSQQAHYAIKPAWVAEVNSRLPEFAANWKRDGEPLMRAIEQIVGTPFRDKELLVALSVCSFPSMSDPLLVNVRFSLKSFTPDSVPPDVTTSIILHEILHHYLSDKLSHGSRLLRQYAGEDETVTSHLHLMALMNAAYVTLREPDTMKRVIAKDRELPNRSYGRAWDIVQAEGYSAFVSELK